MKLFLWDTRLLLLDRLNSFCKTEKKRKERKKERKKIFSVIRTRQHSEYGGLLWHRTHGSSTTDFTTGLHTYNMLNTGKIRIEIRTENCTTCYMMYTHIHVHYHNNAFGLYVHYNKFFLGFLFFKFPIFRFNSTFLHVVSSHWCRTTNWTECEVSVLLGYVSRQHGVIIFQAWNVHIHHWILG